MYTEIISLQLITNKCSTVGNSFQGSFHCCQSLYIISKTVQYMKKVNEQLPKNHDDHPDTAQEMTKEDQLNLLQKTFLDLNRSYLTRGVNLNILKSVCNLKETTPHFPSTKKKKLILSILLPIILIKIFALDSTITTLVESRCLLMNNYLIWEFTRPVSDCSYCEGVDQAIVFQNLSKEYFKAFAYSPRPMIAKRAAADWPASQVFNLNFFRNLYGNIPGAYESIIEECQFLHFHSDFENLEQVLTMDPRRALNLEGEKSWYVGWKNCHPQVLEVMRKFYRPPDFLPDDAEIPQTNYVFLGYNQGAHMHLDYIPRLMWQAQLRGSKTWSVAPTPECNNVCKPFTFFVDESDVVLLDTRIWYHSTQVENGTLSLTVTSEYG